jgi:hypothetical protein
MGYVFIIYNAPHTHLIRLFQQTGTLVEGASQLGVNATDNAGDFVQESCTLSGSFVECAETVDYYNGLSGATTITESPQFITATFPATATKQAGPSSKSSANRIHSASSYKGTIIGCVAASLLFVFVLRL